MKAFLVLSLLALSTAAFADSCGSYFDEGNKNVEKINQIFKDSAKYESEMNALKKKGASKAEICNKAMDLRKSILISVIHLRKGKTIWTEAKYSCSGSDSENAEERADKMDDSQDKQSNDFIALDKALVNECGAESLVPIFLNM